MHRGAMNRVRSEEAALSRSLECRGKPGPFWGQACHRAGGACANRHWRTLQWVPAPQSPPGSAPRPTQVAHVASPAPFGARLAIAQAAPARIGTGVRSQWLPAPQSPPGLLRDPLRSRTWQARPLLGPGLPPFAQARGLRSIGTGVRSQWVPAPQSPPGSAPRPTQVAHVASPAPFEARLAIAQAAPVRIGTGIRSQ